MEDTDKLIDWYIKYIYTKNLVPAPIQFVVDNLKWAVEYVDKKKPNLKEEYPESRERYVANLIQKAWVDQNESDYCVEYTKIYTHLKEKFRTYFQ